MPWHEWWVGTLRLDSLTAMSDAFASEVGQKCAVDRRVYAPAPSKFQMFMFDDKVI